MRHHWQSPGTSQSLRQQPQAPEARTLSRPCRCPAGGGGTRRASVAPYSIGHVSVCRCEGEDVADSGVTPRDCLQPRAGSEREQHCPWRSRGGAARFPDTGGPHGSAVAAGLPPSRPRSPQPSRHAGSHTPPSTLRGKPIAASMSALPTASSGRCFIPARTWFASVRGPQDLSFSQSHVRRPDQPDATAGRYGLGTRLSPDPVRANVA